MHAVCFYDKELLLVSLAVDGEMILWDAQKLEKLQTVRNRQYMIASAINSSCFNKDNGTMLLGTTKLFEWRLEQDETIKVTGEQQSAVARDYLTQFKRGLKLKTVPQPAPKVPAQTSFRLIPNFQTVSDKIDLDRIVNDKTKTAEAVFNSAFGSKPMASNVLPSKHTELVGCFYCY